MEKRDPISKEEMGFFCLNLLRETLASGKRNC